MPADAPVHAASAVVLDLGGVLLHVHFERTLAHWADAAGVARAHFAASFEPDEAYARHERGEFAFSDYAVALRRGLGVDLDDDRLLTGWNLALGEAMHGARELVQALARRGPLYLFSNSNAAHYAAWSRDQATLLEPFERVFVSHLLGHRKPDPHAFEAIVADIGLAPGDIAFFDDLHENVAGARRAGLAACTVDGPQAVARLMGMSLAD